MYADYLLNVFPLIISQHLLMHPYSQGSKVETILVRMAQAQTPNAPLLGLKHFMVWSCFRINFDNYMCMLRTLVET